MIPTVSSNVFDILGSSRRSPGSDCRRQIVTTITSFLSDYYSDDYIVDDEWFTTLDLDVQIAEIPTTLVDGGDSFLASCLD